MIGIQAHILGYLSLQHYSVGVEELLGCEIVWSGIIQTAELRHYFRLVLLSESCLIVLNRSNTVLSPCRSDVFPSTCGVYLVASLLSFGLPANVLAIVGLDWLRLPITALCVVVDFSRFAGSIALRAFL